jgi:threonine synthase
VYDFQGVFPYHPSAVEPDLPGIWPYRQAFLLPDAAPVVSLGEGRTPLIWGEAEGRRIGFKLESLNPTGSHKDRGTAVLAGLLAARNIQQVVEDSSGNAGASLAAYCARLGIRAEVYFPAAASGPKRHQIERLGGIPHPVPGPREAAARAVLEAAEAGAHYASHAYLPFDLPGFATIAYELYRDLGESPGAVIAPVGHGSLLLGIIRGFQALRAAGVIREQPAYVGVQSAACAPLAAAYRGSARRSESGQGGKSAAQGVQIAEPVRAQPLVERVRESGGLIMAVSEPDLEHGHRELRKRGLDVEATSALVWSAIKECAGKYPGPVIAVLTGHGLKEPDGQGSG